MPQVVHRNAQDKVSGVLVVNEADVVGIGVGDVYYNDVGGGDGQ